MQLVHGNIPNMFDNWVDLVIHLLILENSMTQLFSHPDSSSEQFAPEDEIELFCWCKPPRHGAL